MSDAGSLELPDRATVLVVDDTPDNLTLISALLKDICKVKVANSGEKALRHVQGDKKPDLILLDIMMPGMSGFDVIRELKADPATRDIPVIFLSAMSSVGDEEKGFELGAVDYITKPVSPRIVLARVKTQLENKAASDFLRDKNAYLEAEVKRRTREVSAIQDVTILAMASLADTRSSKAGNHIRRTQFYVRMLAETLKKHPRFSAFLTGPTIDLLYKSAPLHDIGKAGLPDHIVLKQGRLTEEEFEVMKSHINLGRDAIEHAGLLLGTPSEFLEIATQIVFFHQERWDGSGYPSGASGEEIPIPARLMAVADVYDALVSRRSYKEQRSHDQALATIIEGRGRHFDPDVVDAFVELGDECRAISMHYADSDAEQDLPAGRFHTLHDVAPGNLSTPKPLPTRKRENL